MKLRPLPRALSLLRRVARAEFHRALMNGVVRRRNRCEWCGRRQKRGVPRNSMWGVEAHHDDYAKPLDVLWLCHWCHLTADNRLNDRLKALPEPDEAAS